MVNSRQEDEDPDDEDGHSSVCVLKEGKHLGKYVGRTVKCCKNSVRVLTVTSKYPARRRAPMMISREPIKKRTVARAMALYGTLGGLLLNCRRGE